MAKQVSLDTVSVSTSLLWGRSPFNKHSSVLLPGPLGSSSKAYQECCQIFQKIFFL